MADHSEEARLRAEANFKKRQERAKEGEKAWANILQPVQPLTQTGRR